MVRQGEGVLARSGWAVGMLVGVLVGFVLAVVLGVVSDTSYQMAAIIAYSLVMVPIGFVGGTVAGAIAQTIARSNRRPGPVGYPPMPYPPMPHPPIQYPPVPPRQFRPPDVLPPIHPDGIGSGVWATRYQRCRTAARKFHAIVDATAPSPGRDWLRAIAADLSGELDEVLRLARYGNVLAPDPAVDPEPTAVLIAQRLDTAERAFEGTVARAGRIAVDLGADTDFERIRAELTLLAEQAPHLRSLRGV